MIAAYLLLFSLLVCPFALVAACAVGMAALAKKCLRLACLSLIFAGMLAALCLYGFDAAQGLDAFLWLGLAYYGTSAFVGTAIGLAVGVFWRLALRRREQHD